MYATNFYKGAPEWEAGLVQCLRVEGLGSKVTLTSQRTAVQADRVGLGTNSQLIDCFI